MKITEMTKNEKSLLMFLETCAVDNGGLVNVQHMNSEDMDIAKRWAEEGFLTGFRRIPAKKVTPKAQMFVTLSTEAFAAAHQERTKRATRLTVSNITRLWSDED